MAKQQRAHINNSAISRSQWPYFALIFLVFLKKNIFQRKNNYTVAILTLGGVNSEENKDINISHGANLRMNTFPLKID